MDISTPTYNVAIITLIKNQYKHFWKWVTPPAMTEVSKQLNKLIAIGTATKVRKQGHTKTTLKHKINLIHTFDSQF